MVPDDDSRLAGPGNPGVKQIPVMHKGMGLMDNNYGAGELGPLAVPPRKTILEKSVSLGDVDTH